ncbi:PAS domain S-box protein [archaeon]|nr:PAS domain S-box protein [archaeon]
MPKIYCSKIIHKMNEAANKDKSLKDILNILAKETRKKFDTSSATVYLIKGDHLVITNLRLDSRILKNIEHITGVKLNQVKVKLKKGGYYEKALRTGKSSLLTNPQQIEDLMCEFTDSKAIQMTVPRIRKLLNLHSVIVTPLIFGKEKIGILDIGRKSQFTKQEVEEIRAISSNVTSIIKRKRTEDELKDYKRYLQLVLDDFPDLVMLLDSNAKILEINGKPESFLGFTKKEMIGKSILTFGTMPPKEREKVTKDFKKIFKKEDTLVRQYPFMTKAGESVFVEVQSKEIKIHGSSHVVSLVRNITERKQAEKKLSVSEKRFKSIFLTSPDGILTFDLMGSITSCNPAFLRLTGFTEKEVIGKHFTALPTRFMQDTPTYLKLFESVVTTGKSVHVPDFRWENKKGEVRWGEAKPSIIKCEGKICEIQVILRDITERKELEKKRKKAKKFIEEEIKKKTKQLQIANKLLREANLGLNRDQNKLKKKMNKLISGMTLSKNEKLVLYGLVRYPNLNDQQLSKKIGVKRSTLTAVKNKLHHTGFYHTIALPDFRTIGCELMCIINYSKPLTQEVIKKLEHNPNMVYNLSTEKNFLGVLLSKNFTEAKHAIDLFRETGDDEEHLHVAYYPLETSSIPILDFSQVLAKKFELPYGKEQPKSIKPIAKLKENEKKVLHAILKNPETTDTNLSSKLKMSRSTISQIKKRLIKNKTINIVNIPNMKKLHYELIAYIYSRKDMSKIIKDVPSSCVFTISGEKETSCFFVFENYAQYSSEYKKILEETQLANQKGEHDSILFPMTEVANNSFSFSKLAKL